MLASVVIFSISVSVVDASLVVVDVDKGVVVAVDEILLVNTGRVASYNGFVVEWWTLGTATNACAQPSFLCSRVLHVNTKHNKPTNMDGYFDETQSIVPFFVFVF